MCDLFPRCAGAPYPSGAPPVWTWRRCSAPLLDRMREAQGGRREGRRRGHWPRRWPYRGPRAGGSGWSWSWLRSGPWPLAPGPSKAGRSCIVSGPGGWPPLPDPEARPRISPPEAPPAAPGLVLAGYGRGWARRDSGRAHFDVSRCPPGLCPGLSVYLYIWPLQSVYIPVWIFYSMYILLAVLFYV